MLFTCIHRFCYPQYDRSYCRKLREIEPTCFALDRARLGTWRAIAKIVEETAVTSATLQFRYVGAICSRVKKRLVASLRALRARNKIDEIFMGCVTWRGVGAIYKRSDMSHKVTRKFITIVIRPIQNTPAIYWRDIGSDIATAETRSLPYDSLRTPRVAITLRNLENGVIKSYLQF